MADPTDTTPPLRYDGPQVLADHLARCIPQADAAIVMHRGSADDVVEMLLAAGWRLEDTDNVAGKRVRTLVAPEEEPRG